MLIEKMYWSVVSSPRGSLSPQQALKLANVYLEKARDEDDPHIALVLCNDTEVSLSQAVKRAKNHTVIKGIVETYADLGRLLESRGRSNEARDIYKKAAKLG